MHEGGEGKTQVIAVYRPKAGKDAELRELMKEHVPILRRLGLATDDPAISMIAQDGTIVETFAWVSTEAIERAHSHPDVLAMWARYDACCEYGRLADLAETGQMFPGFTPLYVS